MQSLKGLQDNLNFIHQYLEKVLKHELPINHGIVKNLQNMFNLIPDLKNNSMTVKTNDEQFAIYVASLVRAVLALADLIDNKGMMRGLELELEEK